mgnify:CR=1 FL=1
MPPPPISPAQLEPPAGRKGPYADPAATIGGLYVHVPFCLEKCGYCDFYSLALDLDRVDATVDAILHELDLELADTPFAIRTVFIGGGTPTVLPRPAFDRLFEGISQKARNAARGCGISEFTVEANPATLDAGKARLLRQLGVNRLSFGAQSFNRAELAVLDRRHDPAAVTSSLQIAREAGFEHLSVDLIFGTPGQSLASWRYSLEQAVRLPIDHISAYALMYEANTALTARRDRGLLRPMPEEQEAELFNFTGSFLADAGFARYEISNFARPNTAERSPPPELAVAAAAPAAACWHNLIYWDNRPYVGVGPSAAQFKHGIRRRNIPNLREYLLGVQTGQPRIAEQETIHHDAFCTDLAWLRLRLACGLNLEEYAARTGERAEQRFAYAINRHTAGGLLEQAGPHLRLTQAGIPLASYVSRDFLG